MRYYTIDEAVKTTGIGRSTLYRGAIKKKIKGKVMNGTLVFSRAAINDFIYSHKNDMRTRSWRPISRLAPSEPVIKPVQGKLIDEPDSLLEMLADELGIEWDKPYVVGDGETVKITTAGCFVEDKNGNYQNDPKMFSKLITREVKILGPLVTIPANPKKDDMISYFDYERDIVVTSAFDPKNMLHVLLWEQGLLFRNKNSASTSGREGIKAIVKKWGEQHDDQRREIDTAV